MAKNVATIEDFENLANEMGLVPVQFLIPTITDRKGDIRGYAPYTALRMFNEGMAEPVGKLNAAPAQTTGAIVLSDEDRRKSAVTIPSAWSEIHHLQRIALAKEISGTDDVKTAAAADQIITAEVDRRTAPPADGPGPNAVTSTAVVR
jgi:hypothetical protein